MVPGIDLAISVMPARDLAETIEFYKPLEFGLAYRHPEFNDDMVLRRVGEPVKVSQRMSRSG